MLGNYRPFRDAQAKQSPTLTRKRPFHRNFKNFDTDLLDVVTVVLQNKTANEPLSARLIEQVSAGVVHKTAVVTLQPKTLGWIAIANACNVPVSGCALRNFRKHQQTQSELQGVIIVVPYSVVGHKQQAADMNNLMRNVHTLLQQIADMCADGLLWARIVRCVPFEHIVRERFGLSAPCTWMSLNLFKVTPLIYEEPVGPRDKLCDALLIALCKCLRGRGNATSNFDGIFFINPMGMSLEKDNVSLINDLAALSAVYSGIRKRQRVCAEIGLNRLINDDIKGLVLNHLHDYVNANVDLLKYAQRVGVGCFVNEIRDVNIQKRWTMYDLRRNFGFAINWPLLCVQQKLWCSSKDDDNSRSPCKLSDALHYNSFCRTALMSTLQWDHNTVLCRCVATYPSHGGERQLFHLPWFDYGSLCTCSTFPPTGYQTLDRAKAVALSYLADF